MMRLRFLVPIVGLASFSLFAAACTDSGDSTGDGGAGGEAPAPAGDAGAGGDAAGGTAAGGACSADGEGTVVVQVTGLPDGVAPDILLTGPAMVHATEAGSLPNIAAGAYAVTASRVFDEDAIVRTVFDAKVTTETVCVGDGSSETVKVAYTAIPSSNKLWMSTAKDDELAGFASVDLAETSMTDATVAIHAPAGGSVAFDRDGNLWAVGPTIGGDMLLRIPASELGESGTRAPDVKITVPEITCFPFINHIAFDGSGNLWLSACEDQLHRIKADDLKTSGDKSSEVLFTEVTNNAGIALDAQGNLWVAGGPKLLRFDAARLDLSDTDPADLSISIASAMAPAHTLLPPDELAFDKAGNLWGISGSIVFELASTDLDATGDKAVTADVSFGIDPLALPGTPAFDDSNALWVSFTEGKLAKFSATQLSKTTAPGVNVAPAVLISSSSISSSLPVAFFPAPAGLPLYHSIPSE